MDSDLLHDLTAPEPEVPLPLPTTVSSRSLQPRQTGRSSHSGSTINSAPQSRSTSIIRSHIAAETDPPADVGSPQCTQAISAPLAESPPLVLEDTPPDDGATEGPRKRRRLEEPSGSSTTTSPTCPTLNVPREAAARNPDVDDTMITQSAPEVSPSSSVGHGNASNPNHVQPGDSGGTISDMAASTNAPEKSNVASAAAVESSPGSVGLAGQAMVAESSRMAQQRNVVIDVDALMDDEGPSSAAPRPSPSNISSTAPLPHARACEAPGNTAPVGDEPLSAYSCPVCFCPPVRATMAPCGHVCCGECLFTAIKTTMQRASHTAPVGERLMAR